MATPPQVTINGGALLLVDRDASVQFLTPIMFRVIKELPLSTYEGWVWLDGYQLNAAGDAVQRRSIFVQRHGLKQVKTPQQPSSPARRRP